MLSRPLVEDLITAALSTGGDFAEIFVEDRRSTTINMIGGQVDTAVAGRDFGIGIRIFDGLNCVYAFTNEHDRDRLLPIARQAAQAIRGSRTPDQSLNFMRGPGLNLHPVAISPGEVPLTRKVAVMRQANNTAKNYSPEISQVTVGYSDEDQAVLIANSEGVWAEDRRVRSRLRLSSVASNGSDMQSGFYGPGAAKGFEFFEGLDIDHYARESARIAITNLHADEAPSGRFTVIIDNEFGGVIFHEACGHGLEASAVAKNASVFAGHQGEQIAPSIVTYIDDGTLPNEWGSQNLDDEGEPIRRNVLIENGVLVGYLVDKLNGRRMGVPATGSSRRESYKYAPTSRMTNTFIAPGPHTPEQIIANTEFGIYCRYMGGGSVNPATGEYNFAVNEAYMVRNGKIAGAIRGATLIGTGLDTMRKVDMVANNLAHGAGMCGASSGSIPTNVGQPMVRVSELTVGGRKGK